MLVPVDHRPYALDRRPYVMHMVWHDVLFLHWPVDTALLRALIPGDLALDLFAGQAWLGVVPFFMSGVRPRWSPNLPGASAFGELNVRTYVTRDDKPGVWFFSLDAASRLAVWGARRFFHLPYFQADIRLSRPTTSGGDGSIEYHCRRTHRHAPPAAFRGRYAPTGAGYLAQPGTIDHWLTERYCLYSVDARGRTYRGEIHHEPWLLQPAEVELHENRMAAPLGIDLSDPPAHQHFARRLAVVAWWLTRCI